MNDRMDMLREFASSAGADANTLTMVAGDASNRKYFRVQHGTRTCILMDAPPEKGEDTRPFIAIANWLRAQGLSAPEIMAADVESGFLLLEDLGSDLYARLLERNAVSEAEIYDAAVDVLAHIVTRQAPDLPAYDAEVMAGLAALSVDWYRKGVTGEETPDLSRGLQDLMRDKLAPLETEPPVLIQRDYHAENLIWLPDRHGIARVGLLDFQDAMMGHAAYDLVSILQDARRDVDPEVQSGAFRRYTSATGQSPEFARNYHLLGLQRNFRILGVFARLSLRDGKRGYVRLIPRVWGHIRDNLDRLEDKSLSDFVLSTLPEPTADNLAKLGQA